MKTETPIYRIFFGRRGPQKLSVEYRPHKKVL